MSKEDEVTGGDMLVAALSLGDCIVSGCQSAPTRTVLPAPVGTNAAAIYRNGERIHA